jgi:hypothetical protein
VKQTEKELKERIKYLQEVVAITPIRKAYKAMFELRDKEQALKDLQAELFNKA